MANALFYLDSMRELSVALEKAMLLTQIRLKIKAEYERIQTVPDNNSKALWDTVFESMPRISKLQEEEKKVQNEYVDRISESFRTILRYMITLDESDVIDPSEDGPQKHLQLLYDVIVSRYANDKGKILVDSELVAQALTILDFYSQWPKVNAMKELVNKICNEL